MKEIKIKDLRQFGIALGIILGVIGGIHMLKGHVHAYPWFFWFAVASLLLGAVFPIVLKPLFIIFTKVAHAIGWFNTRVILIVVYYVLLTPIGLIMRILRKDPLDRKIDKNKETYWIDRVRVSATNDNLEKQF